MAEVENNDSRLLRNGQQYRNSQIAKNSDGYTPGNEYCAGVPDTISDGDERGRNPQDEGGAIGTKTDITTRNTLLSKNSNLYVKGNEYCAGSDRI